MLLKSVNLFSKKNKRQNELSACQSEFGKYVRRHVCAALFPNKIQARPTVRKSGADEREHKTRTDC